MLSKQLKDSQRHQRQPKQVELFLQRATFQTMMDGIFEELITEGVVVVYLDDILIFTKTLEEHWEVVHKVVALL